MLPLSAQLTSKTSVCSWRVYPLTNPFSSPAQTDKLFGPAPPSATILTSMWHVPAFPCYPLPVRHQKRVGGLFPLFNSLASLACAQCNTSSGLRLVRGQGVLPAGAEPPMRGVEPSEDTARFPRKRSPACGLLPLVWPGCWYPFDFGGWAYNGI